MNVESPQIDAIIPFGRSGLVYIRGRVESMCRLNHVILSMPIMDRTIVGTFVKIERMPLT